MSALVRRGLAEEGHTVQTAKSGEAAIDLAASAAWDVIVLDVLLPGLDGVEVVRRLRAGGDPTPVLMLTARDAPSDLVGALDAGADDYLTKPFSFVVLLARLRALARRRPLPSADRREIADLVLNLATRTVTRAGQPITLTRTEYNLLECLVSRAGRVVTREKLIESLWGSERDVESNTLDAFIRLLRQKVDRSGWVTLIHTVRGVGYIVDAEREG